MKELRRASVALVCVLLLAGCDDDSAPDADGGEQDDAVDAGGDADSDTDAEDAGSPDGLVEQQMVGWIGEISGFGIRRPGYPGAAAAEDWVIQTLGELGVEDVRTREVVADAWLPERFSLRVRPADGVDLAAAAAAAGVELTADTSGFVELPSNPLAYTPSTPTGGIQTELMRFIRSRPLEEYEGKVVLINYPLSVGSHQDVATRADWVYDRDGSIDGTAAPLPLTQFSSAASTVDSVMAAGAAGAVLVLDNYFDSEQIFGAFHGGRSVPGDNKPAVWVRPTIGPMLVDWLRQGRVDVDLDIQTVVEPRPNQTIIGTLPGSGEQAIMVGSHLDGAWAGAVQDASGCAVVLAQAAHWATVPEAERPHELRFVFTAAHFGGVRGALELAADSTFTDPLLLEIHVEHLAREGVIEDGRLSVLDRPQVRWLYVTENESLRTQVKGSVEEHDLDRTLLLPPDFFGDYPRGDGGPFHLVGVPLVQLVTTPVYLLDAADTPDKVHVPSLEGIHRLIIDLIASSADKTRADWSGSN